ncbi:MAG TPA: sigma-54 dependent transcriptional regulator [Longimicrobium sp.]|nr:sigma-54 dependent transcriptional regulator [Longimicrobium sp.]
MAGDAAVLLIGTQGEVEDAVRAAVAQAGARLRAERSLAAGLAALSASPWRATFLDAEAVRDDPELVRRIAREPNAGALVLVARAPSLRLALDAPRWGAAELLSPPIDPARVAALLRTQASAGAVVPLPRVDGEEDELVGSSAALLDVFQAVGRVAGSDATVLVTGESGTGKELVARALHAASARAAGPFVAVNCAAIPEDLLESELFGHERGAFTGAVARKVGRFERANGGTLFLDEIGDMSLVLQAKILRALQEREVERLGGEERIRLDVRVAAATHRDLPALIESGDFREDLFYRLAVVRLHLPPLRERPGDVRALALHYAARFARQHARPLESVAEEALQRLEAHRWPGNVRELRNLMERAVLMAAGPVLLPEHVQVDARAPAAAAAPAETLPGYRVEMTMAQVEALHIAQVLARVDGHFGRAGEILDMHRNTVSRKALEYGILEE